METSPAAESPSADALVKEGVQLLNTNPLESLRFFKQAMISKPDDLNILLYRATALIRTGKNQEAINAIDDILKRNLASGANLDRFMKVATTEHQSMMPKAKQMFEELSK